MSVFQLVEHPRAHPEELLRGHIAPYLRRIPTVHFVPVHIFLLEKAVMLVEDLPELLEVALRIVGILLYVVASREGCGGDGCRHGTHYYMYISFHRL